MEIWYMVNFIKSKNLLTSTVFLAFMMFNPIANIAAAEEQCFYVPAGEICADGFKTYGGDNSSSRKLTIPATDAQYSVIAVSGGGKHFNRNNVKPRIKLISTDECSIIGHRGGDDKSLYLIKHKRKRACDFNSDAAVQFINIKTKGKKLKITCGDTFDPNYADTQEYKTYSRRLIKNEIHISGGDDPDYIPGHEKFGSDARKKKADKMQQAIDDGEMLYFPYIHRFKYDDHIIMAFNNPSEMYGPNGLRRNGAFLIFLVGSEEGDNKYITKGINKCGNE